MYNGILNLLANDNYLIVNRTLMKELGLEESIIIGELASEYNYYKKNNTLEENDYFYSTIENVEKNTGINEYKQRKALNNLKSKKIIDIKIKGIPAKRYIKINESKISEILNIKSQNNLRTSSLNFKELVPEKLKTNNNNNNNNKKEIYKESYFNSENLDKAIKEWLEYKKERKDKPYTEIGLKKLLTQIKNNVNEYGEQQVVNLIDECMGNNYQGIIFDKLKKQSKKEDDIVEWF